MGDTFIQWGTCCLFAEWQMEQLIDTVWEVGVPSVALPHNESWAPGAGGKPWAFDWKRPAH